MDLSEFLAKKDKNELGIRFDFDEKKPEGKKGEKSQEISPKKQKKANTTIFKKTEKKEKHPGVKFALEKNEQQKISRQEDAQRFENDGYPLISPLVKDSVDDKGNDNNHELLRKRDEAHIQKESKFKEFWKSIFRCTCCRRKKTSSSVNHESRPSKLENKIVGAPGSILKRKRDENSQKPILGKTSSLKESTNGQKFGKNK